MTEFLKTARSWRRARTIPSAYLAAAPISGVYVIGRVSILADLPTSLEWVYVGRSTNLRQRLAQHEPVAEVHMALREWIITNWARG